MLESFDLTCPPRVSQGKGRGLFIQNQEHPILSGGGELRVMRSCRISGCWAQRCIALKKEVSRGS